MLDLANNILSKNLKILRNKRGMSQNTLADRANLTLQYVQNLEYNKKNPSLKTIFTLAEALNISPSLLFIDLDNYEKLDKLIKEYTEFSNI